MRRVDYASRSYVRHYDEHGCQYEFDLMTIASDKKFQAAMLRAIMAGAERPPMRFDAWRALVRKLEDDGVLRRRKRA